MGWFDDITHPIGNFVSQVATNIYNASGDFIGAAGQVVGDVASGGGINAIGQKLVVDGNRLAGSYGTVLGYGAYGNTDVVQHAGDDESTNKWTLGLAGDFAGTGRLFRDAGSTGAYRPEDAASYARFAGKAIAVGSGIYLDGIASSSVGSGGVGSWLSGLTASDYAAGLVIGKTYDQKGAGGALSLISGGVIPPSVGDSIGTTITRPQTPIRGPAGVGAPQVSNPWSFADSGLSKIGNGEIPPLVLAAAAIGLAILYVKVKK